MSDEKNEIISPFMSEMREGIDKIDNKILELLNKRARLVRKVGNWKKENQKKVYDEKREDNIIARLKVINSGPLHDDSLERIFRNIIFEYRTNEHIELDREYSREKMSQDEKGDKRVAIVGVGLMGGSLIKALEKYLPELDLIAYDVDSSLQCSYLVEDIDQVLNSDIIVLATPVRAIIDFLQEYGSKLKKGAIVTDMGSTKVDIIKAANQWIPEGVFFVGGHPLAGKETSGFQNAEADLFHNKTFLITPCQRSDQWAIDLIKHMMASVGSLVSFVDEVNHDRILAYTSHLPQLMAVAICAATRNSLISEKHLFQFIGRNFLEMTRVAASDYIMWKDISLTNTENIKQSIQLTMKELQHINDNISTGDFCDEFAKSKEFITQFRKDLIEYFKGGLPYDYCNESKVDGQSD